MKVHGMRFALVVIAALIVVPAAFAKPTQSSPFFPGGRQYADDLRAPVPYKYVRVDVRHVRQYADDRHARASIPIDVKAPPAGSSMSSDASGFDWGDAGIGAGGVLGLMLLGGGALVLSRSSRKRRLALL